MPEKWYLPQDTRDVADSLEHITNLTAFLEDSFAFRDMNHSFSDKEVCGLCLMFSFIGDVLMRGNQILLRKGGVL